MTDSARCIPLRCEKSFQYEDFKFVANTTYYIMARGDTLKIQNNEGDVCMIPFDVFEKHVKLGDIRPTI